MIYSVKGLNDSADKKLNCNSNCFYFETKKEAEKWVAEQNENWYYYMKHYFDIYKNKQQPVYSICAENY